MSIYSHGANGVTKDNQLLKLEKSENSVSNTSQESLWSKHYTTTLWEAILKMYPRWLVVLQNMRIHYKRISLPCICRSLSVLKICEDIQKNLKVIKARLEAI